jgi:transposase
VLRVEDALEAGEDIPETLEVVPRRWTVIQTVREKLSCRDRGLAAHRRFTL